MVSQRRYIPVKVFCNPRISNPATTAISDFDGGEGEVLNGIMLCSLGKIAEKGFYGKEKAK